MSYISRSKSCPGFPVAVTFVDVEPQVLAAEDASERRGGLPFSAIAWSETAWLGARLGDGLAAAARAG